MAPIGEPTAVLDVGTGTGKITAAASGEATLIQWDL